MKSVCTCLCTLRLLFESEYWECNLFDEANSTKRPRHNLAKHLLCSNSRENDVKIESYMKMILKISELGMNCGERVIKYNIFNEFKFRIGQDSRGDLAVEDQEFG